MRAYYRYASNDTAWLKTIGWPLARGIAAFYASRVVEGAHTAGANGRGKALTGKTYNYPNVMGPDEFQYVFVSLFSRFWGVFVFILLLRFSCDFCDFCSLTLLLLLLARACVCVCVCVCVCGAHRYPVNNSAYTNHVTKLALEFATEVSQSQTIASVHFFNVVPKPWI